MKNPPAPAQSATSLAQSTKTTKRGQGKAAEPANPTLLVPPGMPVSCPSDWWHKPKIPAHSTVRRPGLNEIFDRFLQKPSVWRIENPDSFFIPLSHQDPLPSTEHRAPMGVHSITFQNRDLFTKDMLVIGAGRQEFIKHTEPNPMTKGEPDMYPWLQNLADQAHSVSRCIIAFYIERDGALGDPPALRTVMSAPGQSDHDIMTIIQKYQDLAGFCEDERHEGMKQGMFLTRSQKEINAVGPVKPEEPSEPVATGEELKPDIALEPHYWAGSQWVCQFAVVGGQERDDVMLQVAELGKTEQSLQQLTQFTASGKITESGTLGKAVCLVLEVTAHAIALRSPFALLTTERSAVFLKFPRDGANESIEISRVFQVELEWEKLVFLRAMCIVQCLDVRTIPIWLKRRPMLHVSGFAVPILADSKVDDSFLSTSRHEIKFVIPPVDSAFDNVRTGLGTGFVDGDFPVVAKTFYGRDAEERFDAEFEAYSRLFQLQGILVPRAFVFTFTHSRFLLVSLSGHALTDYSELGHLQRVWLISSVVHVHRRQVHHGDLAPRNVVLPRRGGLPFIIDFDCAESTHCCDSAGCGEIMDLNTRLDVSSNWCYPIFPLWLMMFARRWTLSVYRMDPFLPSFMISFVSLLPVGMYLVCSIALYCTCFPFSFLLVAIPSLRWSFRPFIANRKVLVT